MAGPLANLAPEMAFGQFHRGSAAGLPASCCPTCWSCTSDEQYFIELKGKDSPAGVLGSGFKRRRQVLSACRWNSDTAELGLPATVRNVIGTPHTGAGSEVEPRPDLEVVIPKQNCDELASQVLSALFTPLEIEMLDHPAG